MSSHRTTNTLKPKDLVSSSSSFHSLVAGWENNTCIGKGIQASTIVSYPDKNNCNIISSPPAPVNTNDLSKNNNSVVSITHSNQTSVPSSPQIPIRPNSIFSTSHYRSSSNLYMPIQNINNNNNAMTSPNTPGTTVTASRNALLREQFMTNGVSTITNYHPLTPTTPIKHNANNQLLVPSSGKPSTSVSETVSKIDQNNLLMKQTPTTPTYGGTGYGYRFAGVERLAQRGKIYDSNTPTVVNVSSNSKNINTNNSLNNDFNNDKDFLNSKREYYYRDSSSPTSTLSNGSKDYTRDRLESMGFSNRNNDDIKSSTISKDGEQFVGFSYLPNQIHRKTVKKGFEFTLMVVGESGLGKSTLVNSMFLTDIYSNEYPGPSKRATKTVEVEQTRVLLKEKSVNLYLTVVDTPGYGTAVNNTNCWQPIVNFIESRYEKYLNAETKVHRTHIQDNRVHCCLYFIAPSGHSLKEIDIEFMLHLHDKVNIIPVIAKADSFTPEELAVFKKNILNEINQNKIKIYDFPDGEDEEDSKLLKSLKTRVPFAVVGSNYVLEISGERKRGRKYPWGLVEIESLDHCDFHALRNLLIRHYMLDLIETTNNVHYENYRCRKLTGISPEMGHKGKDNKNPLAQMEEEKKEHDLKMKKTEIEMEQVFEQKVKEKLNKLKETEEEYMRRHEENARKLELQRQELEEKRAAFEKEKAAFELISKDMEEIRRVNTLDVNLKDLNLDGSKNKEKKRKGLF